MSSYVFDTSAWLAYFGRESEEAVFIVDDLENSVETPSIILFELTRKLVQRKHEESLPEIIDFVSKRGILLGLSPNQAIAAGKLSAKENLSAVDAIVYSYAEASKTVLTADKDFKGMRFVKLIQKQAQAKT